VFQFSAKHSPHFSQARSVKVKWKYSSKVQVLKHPKCPPVQTCFQEHKVLYRSSLRILLSKYNRLMNFIFKMSEMFFSRPKPSQPYKVRMETPIIIVIMYSSSLCCQQCDESDVFRSPKWYSENVGPICEKNCSKVPPVVKNDTRDQRRG